MDLTVWLTFSAACIVFSIAPGAGAITSINNSLTGGFKTALKGIVGLQCALSTHLVIVALGLGTLLASSALVFEAIKYAGAVYLLYLGIQKFREPAAIAVNSEFVQNGYGQFVKQAFIVNLMNPKSIVFLSAFLPQFLNPSTPMTEQYLILGITVLLIDAVVMMSYAFLASMVKPYLTSPRVMSGINKVFGGLFITMGLALARSER